MYQNLFSRRCSNKEMVSCVLVHSRFPYYIHLSGSRFKEARKKEGKFPQIFAFNTLKVTSVLAAAEYLLNTLKEVEANGVGYCTCKRWQTVNLSYISLCLYGPCHSLKKNSQSLSTIMMSIESRVQNVNLAYNNK